MSVVHDTFSLERRYPHAPAQVYAAFAEPALRERWFANPGGWANARWSLDFRVGGEELSAGGHPGQRQNRYASRFHEILPEQRIVYAYDLLHDEVLVSVSLATVELAADGTGTLLRLTEQGAFLDGDPGAPGAREHGTGVLLDRLGRFLAGKEQ